MASSILDESGNRNGNVIIEIPHVEFNDGRLKFLILNNVQKRKNVIQLLESAAVYGYVPVMVQMDKIKCQLPPHVVFDHTLYFETLVDMRQHMEARDVRIVGIEILDQSISLDEYKFPTNIALMPGNEALGLSSKQIAVCDDFVYIPHYGNGTASLNVHVATGVILHHDFLFHEQLQQPQR